MITHGGGSEDRLSRPPPLRKPQLATDRKRKREPILEKKPITQKSPQTQEQPWTVVLPPYALLRDCSPRGKDSLVDLLVLRL